MKEEIKKIKKILEENEELRALNNELLKDNKNLLNKVEYYKIGYDDMAELLKGYKSVIDDYITGNFH